jgi:hypothetical protein
MRRVLSAEKAARIEQLIQILGDIALNDKNAWTRIQAAVKVYDHIAGKPVATLRNENRNTALDEMILKAVKRREKPAV